MQNSEELSGIKINSKVDHIGSICTKGQYENKCFDQSAKLYVS